MPRGERFAPKVMLRAMREVDNGVPVTRSHRSTRDRDE